ncbi:MAG: type I glyceraldehyde-3-phosphate dehydrogenase [Acidobacteria bacterium]|nr:type I glyceraldehyde-3-phosphate dehydrogenase [Acidobacteriota bacterium]MCB9397237.1 type I glyceraldehyde-3-phosphate dehydrogenase [Acidobacteriota bacterium]
MSRVRIAINGFGRIGRTIARIAKSQNKFDLVAVNDLTDPEYLAYALKYDSTHGIYPGKIAVEGNGIRIDRDVVKVLAEPKPENLPWKELKIDYVIESTGIFRKIAQVEQHLSAGAKRVIVSVPLKDECPATIVMGVNDDLLNKDIRVISNASCTTNCAAPLAKIIHEAFGIERGLMNTVHAYTADQRLLDAPHSDFRRSRSAAENIVPTSTGAARTVGKVYPPLKGKLDGFAIRVPVSDGSIVDLTLHLSKAVTVEEINAEVKRRAQEDFMGVVSVAEAPLVSCDIVGNPHSCIFDPDLTRVIDGNFVKVVAWYDNEFGYSSRMVDLIEKLADMDGLSI